MNEIFTSQLLPWILSVLGPIATWFVSQKKAREEAKATELDNVEKAVKIWRDLAEDLSDKLKVLTEKCDHLEQSMEAMNIENRSLKEQIAGLTAQ